MLENRKGQTIPDLLLRQRRDGRWVEIQTAELFKDRKVILFSLPGAFTPTCSTSHVPRYNELQPVFKAQGIDEIICVSVNDPFVMEAWRKDQGAEKGSFLADGNGEFTKGMGMLVKKHDLNFGARSWRYSMLVDDGVILEMFIEPQIEGDPYEVSDADTMLNYLAPEAKLPSDILLLTKPGCGHCARAKSALKERGLQYEELTANPRSLRAVSAESTTPQVFIDGKHIGGADELIALLERQTQSIN